MSVLTTLLQLHPQLYDPMSIYVGVQLLSIDICQVIFQVNYMLTVYYSVSLYLSCFILLKVTTVAYTSCQSITGQFNI